MADEFDSREAEHACSGGHGTFLCRRRVSNVRATWRGPRGSRCARSCAIEGVRRIKKNTLLVSTKGSRPIAPAKRRESNSQARIGADSEKRWSSWNFSIGRGRDDEVGAQVRRAPRRGIERTRGVSGGKRLFASRVFLRRRGPVLPGDCGRSFRGCRIPQGRLGIPGEDDAPGLLPGRHRSHAPTGRRRVQRRGHTPERRPLLPDVACRVAPLAAGVFVPRPIVVVVRRARNLRDDAILAERDGSPSRHPPCRGDARRARPARGCAAATDRGANRRVRGRGCAVARAAPRGRRRPGAGVSPSARRNTRNGFPGEKKETAARRRRPPRVRAADAHHRLFLGVPRARAAGACATHRRRAGCARPRDVQSGDARRRDDGCRLRLRRRRARQTSCARRRRLLRRRRRIVGNAERHARRSARRRARLGITRDASIGAARRAEPRETGRRTPGRFFSARQRARRPGGGPTRLAHGPREPRDVERRSAFSSRR